MLAYDENGEETEEPITWTVTGADEDAYELSTEGNTATIKCWGGSVEPAVITASHGALNASATVYLQGI